MSLLSTFNDLIGKTKSTVPEAHYQILSNAYDKLEQENCELRDKITELGKKLTVSTSEQTTSALNNNSKSHKEYFLQEETQLFKSKLIEDLIEEVVDVMNKSQKICEKSKIIVLNPFMFADWVNDNLVFSPSFSAHEISEDIRKRDDISDSDMARLRKEKIILNVVGVLKFIGPVNSPEYFFEFKKRLVETLIERTQESAQSLQDDDINEVLDWYLELSNTEDRLGFSMIYTERVYQDSKRGGNNAFTDITPVISLGMGMLVGRIAIEFHKKFTDGKRYPLSNTITVIFQKQAEVMKKSVHG
jgi:hypothetical protein